MLALRLPVETEERLENLSNKTGRFKSYYIRKAVEEFLEEEAYLLAITRLEEKIPCYV